ncbi:hypothetical protein SPF06_07005 [Sinomonas sp. JGH33]|uniref:Uncharacterized protein n=1 Tax=Sinomonas terricola TaxID=3110330 RepID=A0ABU5T495_9MICC|nr:hypothetical protein [Sinomonas sp. JGH33]MEA5454465.1 hypothetical protein [Sinomonas sp. JGH33]
MDLQTWGGFLASVGTFLGVLGGGVAWLINRADRKRERRERELIAALKERIEELKAAVRRLERKLSVMRRTAGQWREQLIANDIEPDPSEWPKDDENDR